MKFLIIATITLAALIQVGCKKTDNTRCKGPYAGNMQIITDCTGSYLRYQQKDYKVCNINALAGYNGGAWVNASFSKIGNCRENPGYICNMYHENEGFITVLCIG